MTDIKQLTDELQGLLDGLEAGQVTENELLDDFFYAHAHTILAALKAVDELAEAAQRMFPHAVPIAYEIYRAQAKTAGTDWDENKEREVIVAAENMNAALSKYKEATTIKENENENRN